MKKLAAALACLLALAPAWAQSGKYEEVLTQKKSGARTLEVLPGATVRVYLPGCTTSAAGVGTSVGVFSCSTIIVGDTIELAGQTATVTGVPSATSITVNASLTWQKNQRLLRTNAPATVTEDRGGTSALTQPLTADANGLLRFYTPATYFDIKMVFGASTAIIPDARGGSTGAGGDMLRADFDQDSDGAVDLAEALSTPGLVAVTSSYTTAGLPLPNTLPGYLVRVKDTSQAEVYKLSTRTAAGVYEWVDVAYGRAGSEIGYPVYSVDQATAPTLATACPSGYKPILEVRETGQHIACLASLWTELDVGTGESVIDPTGAVLGDALVYNDATQKFEPETLPGGGDMLAATYVDGGVAGVINSAEALYAEPAPCDAGQFVDDIAADGTLSCSLPPSDTSVRMAHTYADAGTGADGSEWTGWEDALAASSTVVLQAGQFQVDVDGFGNLPAGVRVLCREGAVIEWPAAGTRTTGTAMFTLPAGQTAEFQGCSFQPGRTADPVTGDDDGDGEYFLVGGVGSTNTSTLRLIGNTFGPGIPQTTSLAWNHIEVQGAADLLVQGNRFDFANIAIYLIYGTSGTAWTVRAQVKDNVFDYTDGKGSGDAEWLPILGDSTSGSFANVVTLRDSTFSGNVVRGWSGKVINLSMKLVNFSMIGNVFSGNKTDTIFGSQVRDTANALLSENVTIEGNTCAAASPSICQISVGETTGATISGNRLVMNTSTAAHSAIEFLSATPAGAGVGAPASTGAVIEGNHIEYLQRVTAQEYAAIALGRAEDVVLHDNMLVNGPQIGVGVGTSTTSVGRLSASGNVFINRTDDTGKLTAGAFRFRNNTCTDCIFTDNQVHEFDPTNNPTIAMFAAPSAVPTITSVGNFGGALRFSRYRVGTQELGLGGDLVTLKRNDLQSTNAYTIELPRDAPSSTADSVLTYRRDDLDFFWDLPPVYEGRSTVVWPTVPGVDSNATTTNSAYAANSYTDLKASTAVPDNVVGSHTWSWPAGSYAGRLRAWWSADGTGVLYDCTNSTISLQYSTNAGGAWVNLFNPITCADDDCSAAGAGTLQFIEVPLPSQCTGSAAPHACCTGVGTGCSQGFGAFDLTNLRFRTQINTGGTPVDRSCWVRVGTLQFQIAGQWTAGTTTRIRDRDLMYPTDWEFGRGVVEDVSLWFWTGTNGPRILWRDTTGTANDCFEFDHDATAADGTRFCEDTKIRNVTDFYLGTAAGGDASIFLDGNNSAVKLWWDDDPGVTKLDNSDLQVTGAVTAGGAVSAASFAAAQNATTGHQICFLEGVNHETDAFCLKIPDTGLDLATGATDDGGWSGGICTLNTKGTIPDACIEDGTDAGGAGATVGATGERALLGRRCRTSWPGEAAFNYNAASNTLSVDNLAVTNFTANTSATELDIVDGGIGLAEVTPGAIASGLPADNPQLAAQAVWFGENAVVWEGTLGGAGNAVEVALVWNPTTVDKTITLPNADGNVLLDTSTLDPDLATDDTVDDDNLDVASGGTGVSTFTDGGVLVGNAANDVSALTVGTNGQVLVGSTGADPVFATVNADRSLTTTLGAGTFEIDADDELYTDAACGRGPG